MRRLLIFKPGERVSLRVIDETVRLIRQSSSVYDVDIRPVRYEDGVVDIAVTTRDTWTLEPGARIRRAGGVNSGALNIKETNLAGTGTTVGLERRTDVDRSGTAFQLSHEHLFDGWTSANLERVTYSDGSSATVGVTRPFYALDTRWAAGASASRFDRLDNVYEGGSKVSAYRHRQHTAETFGGWSPGLVNGWTHRYSAGLSYSDDIYSIDPGQPLTPQLPPDKTRAGPFLRYEVVQDDFMPVMNRDRIQRPEYLTMGLASAIQVGRSLAVLGSTDQPWQLSANVAKGFRVSAGHELLTSANYSAQYGNSTGDVRSAGGAVRYFVPQHGAFLLYLAANGDVVRSPNFSDELLLGGDNGLRGYPLRYQRGRHRMLFTAEERYYSDWYPFRLFRVGVAAYYDVGRAWTSQIANPSDRWLSDFGVGLRFLNARTSFGNILHVDLAFPLHKTDSSIRSRQLLVMTQKTF